MDVTLKLKSKMVLLNMSLEELAKQADISRATLYRWFNDNCRAVPLESVRKISEALRLTRDEVLDIFLPNYSQM